MQEPSVMVAAREAIELAVTLDALIEQHLECLGRNYVGRSAGLDEFLWESKVGILRALQALPKIEEAAKEEEREVIANKAREWAGHYSQGSDGRNTFICLAEWIEARNAAPHSDACGRG